MSDLFSCKPSRSSSRCYWRVFHNIIKKSMRRSSIAGIQYVNHFKLKKLFDFYERYSDFEGMLYGSSSYSRDHIFHSIRTWLLGVFFLLNNQVNQNRLLFDNNSEKIGGEVIFRDGQDLHYRNFNFKKTLEIKFQIDGIPKFLLFFVVV